MNQQRFFRIPLIVCAALVLSILSAVAQVNSLTRGSRFTVIITGLPHTTYYVWLTETWSMSGEPGDQLPIISDEANVQKDPPGVRTLSDRTRRTGGRSSTMSTHRPRVPRIQIITRS